MRPRFRTNPKRRKKTFIVQHVPTRTISVIQALYVAEVYSLFSPGVRIPFNHIIIIDEY